MAFYPEKTEIMHFSNSDNRNNFNFVFDNVEIPINKCYKRLGVSLSSHVKWKNHIENVVKGVSKHLRVLRKLKYKLSRTNLEKLYLS